MTKAFGVPGDFNLTFLDDVEASPIEWIGCANELNASYAADGYARVKQGLGVSAAYYAETVLTTSAAGLSYDLRSRRVVCSERHSWSLQVGQFDWRSTAEADRGLSERVPILHIVGVPSTGLQTKKALLHHTLGDGRFDAYLNCYKQFTIAQAALNKPNIRTGGSDVSDEIDRIIKAALVHCRPTYLTLPTDLVEAMIPAAPLKSPLTLLSIHQSLSQPKVSEKVENSIIKQITAIYEKAERPIILVDACCIRYGVQSYTKELIDKTGMVRQTEALTICAKPAIADLFHLTHGQDRY